MMEGPPGADSEEKHEPASDVDTVAVDSLKALDPEWPIREDCSTLSSNPMMEGPPGADSEEKHEPASDVDTVAVDSLKALDPEWPIREDDPGGNLSASACEDAAQSETTDAADPSQAATVESHRHRERPARYFTQLRPQGRNRRKGEVRSAHQGACREPPRLGSNRYSSSGGRCANRPSSCIAACW